MAGKQKLIRFEQMKNFSNVFEEGVETFRADNFPLKGKWNSNHFKNDRPITLELACGKGEFTVNLAEKQPERNYIGIDIKGARMFVGAKDALDKELSNAAFLRTRIDFITAFFGNGEIDEIWLVHPDPHLKDRRERKRLTSPMFIARYREILKPGGVIRLKTDSKDLFDYSLEQIEEHSYELIQAVPNVYQKISSLEADLQFAVQIRTHYEEIFEKRGHSIHYLSFRIS